jgi:hypothetical protein
MSEPLKAFDDSGLVQAAPEKARCNRIWGPCLTAPNLRHGDEVPGRGPRTRYRATEIPGTAGGTHAR